MSDVGESEFNDAYLDRVKNLREARGLTAAEMAKSLGVPAERYRKYETRSPLPPYLIERFCLVGGCDVKYLITGKKRAA
jgi:transcriptional regulator with XRE-family HTH domain